MPRKRTGPGAVHYCDATLYAANSTRCGTRWADKNSAHPRMTDNADAVTCFFCKPKEPRQEGPRF